MESQGFKPCALPSWVRKHRSVAFEGILDLGKASEAVSIIIEDWDFIDPPTVVLKPGSKLLNGTHPHIGVGGAICYRTQGIGVLNAHAPENAVAACLVQAGEVIQRIRGGGQWIADEIQREFDSYWHGIPLLSCGLNFEEPEARLLFSEDEERLHGWLYQDDALAHSIVDAMGMKGAESGKVLLVKSSKPLIVGNDGPPQDLKRLLSWMRCHEAALERRVLALLSEKNYFKGGQPIVVINAPNATIGIRTKLHSSMLLDFAKRPREFEHRAKHPYFPPLPIKRFSVIDSSPEFVYARNGQKSLRGKRVTLIGAGAIGGYLADNLARLGAGYSGGQFTIVDSDILLPDNIGRHRLGIDSIFRRKAIALSDRLKAEFPWLNIRPLVTDVRNCRDIFSADLVIDATGDEALGRAINRLHIAANSLHLIPPVLYCWISGEGEGAQALWVEQKGRYACWECLLEHGDSGDWKQRFPFVRHETQLQQVGCKAVTPYGASAAMIAAALASEMVVDWLSNRVDPRFRSRSRTHADVIQRRDSSPVRLKRCPACNAT